MPIVTFFENKIRFDGNPTLKEVLADFLPCAKTGVCGGCTLKACRRTVTGDTVIDSDIVIETGGGGEATGVAIDIGTTTVVCESIKDGVRTVAAAINPQTIVAPDVIGRIEYALCGGKELLQNMIQSCVRALFDKAGGGQEVVITGNTAMLQLLCGIDVSGLARAPFEPQSLFGEYIGGAYIPRCIGAFVGADTTCAVMASGMCDRDETALLVDIGTNGEIALWHGGKLYVTSCAAGPVFEGAGLECGMTAKSGAIDRVYNVGNKIFTHTIGNEKAVGICGSGVIDAVAVLCDLGNLHCKKAVIDGDVYITQDDIQKIIFGKAAIGAGIEVLSERAGICESDIDTLYIAGGFGSHINLKSAVKIGLVPNIAHTRVLGNAALCGARLLLDKSNIEKSLEIARSAIAVNLGGNEQFNKKFIENMKTPR